MNSKAHVSLNGMALRGINVILDHDGDGVSVRVDLHVPSRSDGAPMRTTTKAHIGMSVFDSAIQTRSVLKDVILAALGHEIDEWMSIDGVRKDPHAAAPEDPHAAAPVVYVTPEDRAGLMDVTAKKS